MMKFKHPKINKPLDRNYFKKKANPNAKKALELTECCGEDIDRELVLNVKNKKDWELIEEYIESKLIEYSSTESITPISCTECGRFLKYQSKIKDPKGKRGWYN
jgi:hypothetical protein